MLYCFVEEDLLGLCDDNPLLIQVNYAKRLGLFCSCSLTKETIHDEELRLIDLNCEHVFLRATCDTTTQAACIIEKSGAKLIETPDDIRMIENWDSLPLAKRRIFSVKFKDLLDETFSDSLEAFLSATPFIFAKTRKKGFCVEISSQRLLHFDSEISDFFNSHCTHKSDELMISEKLEVKADSLGLRETRHFVFNGTISNSSRTLHSVKHTVPQTLLDLTINYVEIISAHKAFPKNYVIDVGEFNKNGSTFLDIVELNPISSSLCYVNNSIFDIVVPEVAALKKSTGMGVEYCYDAMMNKTRYTQSRYSNANYTYSTDERYCFL